MTKKKNELLSASEAISAAWRLRHDYKGYDRSAGSQFNSWRAIINTAKGKAIGFPDAWRSFDAFVSDVSGEWERGKIVRRVDVSRPHSSDNSFWGVKGEENSGKLVRLSVDGIEKTLLEWCAELGLNYQGVRQRYFRGKNLSPSEILHGKTRAKRNQRESDYFRRTNALLGAYKLRDKKRGLENDMTISVMRKLISNGCVYCGDDEAIGLDRIDNTIGHSVANVVPCCYTCNTARNNNFSFSEMLVVGETIKKIKEARRENKQE